MLPLWQLRYVRDITVNSVRTLAVASFSNAVTSDSTQLALPRESTSDCFAKLMVSGSSRKLYDRGERMTSRVARKFAA